TRATIRPRPTEIPALLFYFLDRNPKSDYHTLHCVRGCNAPVMIRGGSSAKLSPHFYSVPTLITQGPDNLKYQLPRLTYSENKGPFQTPLFCKPTLLGQPCDLEVRGDRTKKDFGRRRRDEAEFVFLFDGIPGDAKSERLFLIEGMGSHGEPWTVDFRKAFSVNLRILDIAVYNNDGRVLWKIGQEAPVQLLPGWQKRFKEMAQRLGNGDNQSAMGPLSYFDNENNLQGNLNDSCYSFPLVRIGRIRSPYAEAIQGSYAAFNSRAALSHDFAKNLWAAEPDEQQVE
ncbi:MAG: hypothetical protein KKB20_22980, partial [Proteobacteria bacterium]|nr:hypothetical protein [Pseudomonadota bacterium]